MKTPNDIAYECYSKFVSLDFQSDDPFHINEKIKIISEAIQTERDNFDKLQNQANKLMDELKKRSYKLEVARTALEDIKNEDFRGNRPYGATVAYKALRKMDGFEDNNHE